MIEKPTEHTRRQAMHHLGNCVNLSAASMRLVIEDSAFKRFHVQMAQKIPSAMLHFLKETKEVCENVADENSKKRRLKHEEKEAAKRAKLMGGPEVVSIAKASIMFPEWVKPDPEPCRDHLHENPHTPRASSPSAVLSDAAIHTVPQTSSSPIHSLFPAATEDLVTSSHQAESTSDKYQSYGNDKTRDRSLRLGVRREESTPPPSTTSTMNLTNARIASAADGPPNQSLSHSNTSVSNDSNNRAPVSIRPKFRLSLQPTLMRTPKPTVTTAPPNPSRYEIELGITNGTSRVVDLIKDYCLATFPQRRDPNPEARFHELVKTCSYLEFDTVKNTLANYLNERKDEHASSAQLPYPGDLRDEDQIVTTIQTYQGITEHSQIMKAYSQMHLFNVSATDAKNAGGQTSVRDKRAKAYAKRAGRKWLDLAKWFGGNGIVIIFVLAGFANTNVESRWTEFQRDCLKHLATFLDSIRDLVAAIGENGLEEYCKNGKLSPQHIERIEQVEGYLANA